MNVDFKLANKLKKKKKLYSKWKMLVEKYGNILDSKPSFSDITFTPHDYSHHCVNIYKHLGEILPDSFYKNTNQLFVLMVAVLFHDYGIRIKSCDEFRKKHSQIAREWFVEKAKEPTDMLSDCIKDSWVDIIGDIILSHSNIKEGTKEKNTLKSTISLYETNPIVEGINVPALCALLRFADELDITYARIEGTYYYEEFIGTDSVPHFDKLHLFNSIDIDKANSPTVLRLNLRQDKNIEDKEDYYNSLVLQVFEKVNSSLKEVNDLVFNIADFSLKDYKINKIIIYSRYDKTKNDEYFKTEVHKKKEILKDANKIIRTAFIHNDLVLTNFQNKHHWIDIKALLNSNINCEVKNNSKLDSEEYIIETTTVFNYITGYISKNILKEDKREKEKIYIVGLNFYGAILSALVGDKSSLPYSYVSCENGEYKCDRIEAIDEDLLILICDVISTSNNLCKLISKLNKLGIGNKRIVIYSLFQRGIDYYDNKTIPILLNPCCEKLYIINNDCKNKENCMGKNCKLYNK